MGKSYNHILKRAINLRIQSIAKYSAAKVALCVDQCASTKYSTTCFLQDIVLGSILAKFFENISKIL